MKVSVVITSYNRPDQIAETLRSISAQSYPLHEVLIADDCSPNDPTSEVLSVRHLFSCKFSYTRHQKNLGMPHNLNYLLEKVTGEIVAICHDADRYSKEYIQLATEMLEKHPTAAFVFSGWKYTDTDRSEYVPHFPTFAHGITFYQKYLSRAISSPIWGTTVVRTSAMRNVGPFDPRYGALADVDYWSKLCMSYDVCYIAKPLLILYPIGTHGNEWSWRRYLIGKQINAAGLVRLYNTRKSRLIAELVLHQLRYLCNYCLGMLHLVRRGRWRALARGISVFVSLWKSA